jgi:hypothetical protein
MSLTTAKTNFAQCTDDVSFSLSIVSNAHFLKGGCKGLFILSVEQYNLYFANIPILIVFIDTLPCFA